MAGIPIHEDIVRGAAAISAFIGDRNVRSTFWKLENGVLPAFKEGNTWAMRKSTYLQRIEEKERVSCNRIRNGEADSASE